MSTLSVSAARTRRRALLLTLPAVAVLAALFLVPMGMLLARSVYEKGWTLAHYALIFSGVEYLRIFWNSFLIALVSTIVCMILGYPTAYVLAHSQHRIRTLLLSLVLIPFWTNVLVRCYAWIILLQRQGPINELLVNQLQILDQRVPLVFNFTGVIIGMVHYLLPPVILILDSVMRTVDPRLITAASSLGASPWKAFCDVFLPQTLPGIKASAMLVFVMALGFFATPALLGGRKELTAAMLISNEFTEMLDWGLGSALATVLLMATVAGLAIYFRLQNRQTSPSPGLHHQ